MLDIEKDGIYTTRYKGTLVGALTRQQQIDAVDCPACCAPRGTACSGDGIEGDKSHRERRNLAMREYGIVAPQAVMPNKGVDGWYRRFRENVGSQPKSPPRRRARRPRGSVKVRFECPICGGPHPRAEHARSRRRRRDR